MYISFNVKMNKIAYVCVFHVIGFKIFKENVYIEKYI